MGDNEDTTKEVSMLFKRSRTEKSICDVDQLILSPTRIIFPVFSNLASVCYRIRPASESPLLSDLLASIFKPPRV